LGGNCPPLQTPRLLLLWAYTPLFSRKKRDGEGSEIRREERVREGEGRAEKDRERKERKEKMGVNNFCKFCFNL